MMKNAAFAAILGLAITFIPTADAQQRGYDRDYVDPDTYEYCQDRAERRSGYRGRTPDHKKDGGVIKGAIGGAILGSIFSDKKSDAGKGAAIGAIIGGIRREKAKEDEARKRRDYRYEFEECLYRRR